MSTLTRNIVYNIVGQIMLLGLSLFSVKYIYSRLGKEEFGIIVFTTFIVTLATSVLEMGVGTAVREIAGHNKTEPQYVRNLIRTGASFYWGLAALLALGIYFLAPVLFDSWLKYRTMNKTEGVFILRVLGISSMTQLLTVYYGSLFRGLQRMEYINITDVVTNVVQNGGTIIFLLVGATLHAVVYWIAACNFLRMAMLFWFAARFFTSGVLLPGYSKEVVKRNAGFSFQLMSITVFSIVHRNVDKILLSKYLMVDMLGYFTLVTTNINKSQFLTNAISQAAYPALSEKFNMDDREGMMAQYNKLQDMTCYLLPPFMAFAVFAVHPVFSYFIAKDIADLIVFPAMLLAVAMYMNGTVNVPHVFSIAAGKPDIASRTNFYGLFTVLPATFVLIYFGNRIQPGYGGLVGAGLSKVVYYFFAYIYGIPRVCRECFKTPPVRWFGRQAGFFAIIILTYGIAWYLQDWLGKSSIVSLAAGYTAGSVIYMIAGYFNIGKELKMTIRSNISMLAGKALKREKREVSVEIK